MVGAIRFVIHRILNMRLNKIMLKRIILLGVLEDYARLIKLHVLQHYFSILDQRLRLPNEEEMRSFQSAALYRFERTRSALAQARTWVGCFTVRGFRHRCVVYF